MTQASTGTGTGSEPRAALPASPVWQAGLLAALAATVVNGIAWFLLQQVFDVGLEIRASPAAPSSPPCPSARSCSSPPSPAWSEPRSCGC